MIQQTLTFHWLSSILWMCSSQGTLCTSTSISTDHRSKTTIIDLPPTSCGIRSHILKACYATHLQLHCLDNPNLSLLNFDFKQNNGTFQPDWLEALLPGDFPTPCKCTACAIKRYPHRNLNISETELVLSRLLVVSNDRTGPILSPAKQCQWCWEGLMPYCRPYM